MNPKGANGCRGGTRQSRRTREEISKVSRGNARETHAGQKIPSDWPLWLQTTATHAMQQEEKTEFALRSTSTDMIMSPAKTGQIRRAIKVGTSGTSWAVVSVTRGLPGLTTITNNKIHCVARRPARSPGLEMPKPLRRAKCQLKTLGREGVRVHSRKEIGPADYRVVLTRYPDPSLGPGAWGLGDSHFAYYSRSRHGSTSKYGYSMRGTR